MRRALFAALLLLAAAFACDATMVGSVVGGEPGCGSPAGTIYSGELFHICGEVLLNGEPLSAGAVSASSPEMGDFRGEVSGGFFSIPVGAEVPSHRYYFIPITLENPCEALLGEVPVEIHTECVMLPPSTIEALPNAIFQGGQFTLEVKNAPNDMQMEITGLNSPVAGTIKKGESWSRTFHSSDCSPLGKCTIVFDFTDTKHEICRASADVEVVVKAAPEESYPEGQSETHLALATLLVLVIGALGAILLNRYI